MRLKILCLKSLTVFWSSIYLFVNTSLSYDDYDPYQNPGQFHHDQAYFADGDKVILSYLTIWTMIFSSTGYLLRESEDSAVKELGLVLYLMGSLPTAVLVWMFLSDYLKDLLRPRNET